MYRRPAKPSGASLRVAAEIAEQRVLTLRDEARAAREALDAAEQHARALRRSHDEAVQRADEARTRALRLAIALAPRDSVPPRLRASVDRQAREQQRTRALEGRASHWPESARVPTLAEAVHALEAARVERARALAALLPELQRLAVEARRADVALREAEEDLARLEG